MRPAHQQLSDYTCHQVSTFFPGLAPDDLKRVVDSHLPAAMVRVQHCVDQVSMWRQGEFNHLNSSQYCQYLYFLANTIWREDRSELANGVVTRLFLLNKALNAIDLFYEIELPEVFFIGHSVGIVLAKATYGNFLVLYQNSTVGKNHGIAPVIGEGVILYPNSAIIGRCHIGNHSAISQGTGVVNRDTPGNCIAFPGTGGNLSFTPQKRPLIADFFRF